MRAHKWWKDEPLQGTDRWRSLEHNGVMFPPAYQPHGVKLLYDGKPVDLTPEQEELVTLYSEFPLDGPQLGNEETAKTFNKNFFNELKKILGSNHIIKSFDKCDFTLLREHVKKNREIKKQMSKEDKDKKKAKDDKDKVKYGYAIVDGRLQKVGNVMIEPPGLFRGRGAHPKTGTFKERVTPEPACK
jgi:DNA topoisomerase-1